MKFRRSGVPHQDALGIMGEVQPLNFAKRSPWKRLNSLLTHIRKSRPDIMSEYIANLHEKYDELARLNWIAERSFDISTHIAEFDQLRAYPSLAISNLNYYLQMLQPPKSADWRNDAVEVPQRNQLRAVLGPKYQNLLVLTETIDRKEAIELYKVYHDEFAREGRSSQDDQYQTLEEFAARWNPESDKENPGLIRIISEVVDGKLYLRKDNCLWNDAISDLDDSEVKYYVCCYGDFDAPRRANRNFVLTMERTIIEGHPFCDSVFHDTRINKDLSHPSDAFFARMAPE
ncbi:MAG: hypothetical protein ACW98Y_01930 [Candidatus Thorarchaeota archaeon]|jgi:hypothetical protein